MRRRVPLCVAPAEARGSPRVRGATLRGSASVTLSPVLLIALGTACGTDGASTAARPDGNGASANDGGGAAHAGAAGHGTGAFQGDGGSGGRGSGAIFGVGGVVPDGGPNALPPAPPWNPGTPLGTPGWGGSTVPFCSKPVGGTASRVWTKQDAVYALVTTDCPNLLGGRQQTCNIPRNSVVQILYKNGGSGWIPLYQYQRAVGLGSRGILTGYSDGRTVIAGDTGSTLNGLCDVTLVDQGGQSKCIWAGPTFSSSAIATAGTDLLLLGRDDDTATKLLEYDGTKWTTLVSWPVPAELPLVVATAGSAALVAGSPGLAWAGDIASGTLKPLPGVPAGDYPAGWIYALDDIFLGNVIGQLTHYDGVKWTTVESGLDQVVLMWGAPDHTVFVASRTTLLRWKAGTFSTVWALAGDASQSGNIMDMWGNSSTEMFFAVKDEAFNQYACGPTFLLWFDGSVVHRF
jgi:hypothetical protein